MPRPYQRTRSRKRKPSRLPGKGATIHYKPERSRASRCSKCGRMLHGVPIMVASKMRTLPASERRVQRMYGRQLCHICLQEALRQAVRSSNAA